MNTRKKMGFLGRFIANNVNLADPAASTKWKSLTRQIEKYEAEVSSNYKENDSLSELFHICQSEDTPGKLMAFGRNLEEFLNTADKSTLRKDNQLLKLVELYSGTTIASNDNKAINLATNIMQQIMKIRRV